MSPAKKKSDWPMPEAKPEEVGMSSKSLSRIKPFLSTYITRKMTPNFTTLVIRQGKVVHHEIQGYMDFESKTPVTPDTLYRLYSNTKPVTGVAAMICVEEGLFSLDDPVSKYIPAFRNQRVRATAGQGPMMGTPTVPVNREMTIRDCLRNTTGMTTARSAPLAYLTEFKDLVEKAGLLRGLGGNPTIGVRETIEALGQLPLEAHPGTVFEYHIGFPVAGVVIETVTGKSLDEFFTERIFRPLGMNDTSVYLDEERLKRFPTMYTPVPEKGKWKLAVSEKPEQSRKLNGPKNRFDAGGGDGGILSTAADYARVGQMLLNKGELDGVRIISRRSVEIMTSNHTGTINIGMSGPNNGFGIGVGVARDTGGPPVYRSVGSFGWGGAAGTTLFVDPKEELVGVCFSQVLSHIMMPGNTYQEDFERIVYESIL
jgi:CubicO group peptidase (beta-lactamase class C family)